MTLREWPYNSFVYHSIKKAGDEWFTCIPTEVQNKYGYSDWDITE